MIYSLGKGTCDKFDDTQSGDIYSMGVRRNDLLCISEGTYVIWVGVRGHMDTVMG